MTLHLRPSTDADLPHITAIYAHHVLHGTGTFEVEPPSEAEMGSRRADVLSKGLPWLVASDGVNVLGYAYCNWFKPRPAYRFSAEDSIYMAPDQAGKGIGAKLLNELIAQATRAGVRKLIAVIGDTANAGSIGLHRSTGFEHVGLLRNCGWKFDRWLDVVMMDRAIGDGANSAPTIMAGPTTALRAPGHR